MSVVSFGKLVANGPYGDRREAMNGTIPAYDTKHLSLLTCHVGESRYVLHQDNASGETGSTLWLSSQILIGYMLDRRQGRRRCRGRFTERERVLELGSGIGLTALALRQMLHADVVASDCAAILPILTQNISENPVETTDSNAGQIQIKCIDWCEKQDPPDTEFDMIVASDVIYSPDLLDPLLETILTFMSRRTTLYLAQEVRVATLLDRFLGMCGEEMKITRIAEQELESVIQERFTRRPSPEDAEHQTPEGMKDWSGVAIYKMKLKVTKTRKSLRSTLSTLPSSQSDR